MWFIVALVVGLVVALGFWLHSRNVNLTWYEWLIGIVGVFLILFTIQNYFASLDELKNTAANYFLLITGLPGVVLLGLSVLLVFRRARA